MSCDGIMSSDVTIRISGLWKRYGLPMPRFVQKGMNLIKGRNPDYQDDDWWALRRLVSRFVGEKPLE